MARPSGGTTARRLRHPRHGPRAAACRADEATYYDFDQTGFLSDSERDEDADGLTNWAETRGCMNAKYWAGVYNKETPYYITYAGTQLDVADTDGDGIRDGADDQDHDDVPNVMECSRILACGPGRGRSDGDEAAHRPPWKGFVQPLQPVRAAHQVAYVQAHRPGGRTPWAPFNPQDEYYWIRD